MPVWYLLADDNGTPRCYLSGASIGRVMQGRSWAEIMGNYAPCADTDALCSGCALFGTVKGKGTHGCVSTRLWAHVRARAVYRRRGDAVREPWK